MIIVEPNATEFNLARANPSSLLNMSMTTQMDGCILRPILLTEFHDSDLLLQPSSSLITCSYLFQRLMANLAFLLGHSGFLAFLDPNQVDSKYTMNCSGVAL